MIDLVRLDITERGAAQAVLQLQRRAYRIESDLIGSEEIPPLRETLDELQSCGEEFLGALVDGLLAGAISWRFSDGTIDIHRLVVEPRWHRRGIGTALVRRVLQMEPAAERAIVQTGAENYPAAALYLREGFALVEEANLAGLRVSRFAKNLWSAPRFT
jgi:GNAT superfamily N-acetyltransferase